MSSVLSGRLLPSRPEAVCTSGSLQSDRGRKDAPRRPSPFFPEMHDEIKKSWNMPLTSRVHNPRSSLMSSLDGADKWGMSNSPLWEVHMPLLLLFGVNMSRRWDQDSRGRSAIRARRPRDPALTETAGQRHWNQSRIPDAVSRRKKAAPSNQRRAKDEPLKKSARSAVCAHHAPRNNNCHVCVLTVGGSLCIGGEHSLPAVLFTDTLLEVCYPTRTRGSRNTVGFRVGFRVNV